MYSPPLAGAENGPSEKSAAGAVVSSSGLPNCFQMTHESAFWGYTWITAFDHTIQLAMLVIIASNAGGAENLVPMLASMAIGTCAYGYSNKDTLAKSLEQINPVLVSETWFGLAALAMALPFVGPGISLYSIWFSGAETAVQVPSMSAYCGDFEDGSDLAFQIGTVLFMRAQSIGVPLYVGVSSGVDSVAVLGAVQAVVDLAMDAWLFRFQAIAPEIGPGCTPGGPEPMADAGGSMDASADPPVDAAAHGAGHSGELMGGDEDCRSTLNPLDGVSDAGGASIGGSGTTAPGFAGPESYGIHGAETALVH